MLLLLTNTSLTALSSFLFFSLQTSLSRMQQLTNQLLDPLLSCRHLFKHQANCLQAIHKTIQQFTQHLKEEHLDRQTLQLIVLQLQNDFALLRYLLPPITPPRTKTSNTANADFQPTPNTQEAPSTTVQTSHQEFANWKNCLPMKYQLTHPLLRGSISNTFSHMINFASLNLAIQMLSFGRSLQ